MDPEDPSLHVLNITMSPPVVRVFSQKLHVSVALPEGAFDIELLIKHHLPLVIGQLKIHD